MAAIDELRNGFRRSSLLMKVIWINIGIFVLLRLTAIVGVFTSSFDLIDHVLHMVEMPSMPALLISRPWTVLTYMFSQYELMHLLFNMLWLYWFGTLFTMRCTGRQLVALYVYGGIAGAILFFTAYNLIPFFTGMNAWLIGSSASVMAIVTATAILMPEFRMNLLFFGSVALKWIAIASILLVLVGISGTNAGGEMAHVGGILMGILFALRLKKGRDITRPFNSGLDKVVNIFSRVPYQRTTSYNYTSDSSPRTSSPASDEAELNDILDKIRKSGYSGLTPDERRRLFELSRNIK